MNRRVLALGGALLLSAAAAGAQPYGSQPLQPEQPMAPLQPMSPSTAPGLPGPAAGDARPVVAMQPVVLRQAAARVPRRKPRHAAHRCSCDP